MQCPESIIELCQSWLTIAVILSLRVTFRNAGSRISGGVSSIYLSPHSLMIVSIFANHGDLVAHVSCVALIWRKRVEEILLAFQVASRAQKLSIHCFMLHESLVRPSSPMAILFAVLGLRRRIYLQKELCTL